MDDGELSIDDVKTSKDLMKDDYPELCKDYTVPCPNKSLIVIGASGSGKSVFIHNLIKKFWKDYFNIKDVYLLSTTAKTDDVLKSLGVPSSNVFTDIKKGMDHLKKICAVNEILIEHLDGNHKCPHILIYYDDCISDKKVMKDPFMLDSFIRNRHFNATVILGSQYWKALPPPARTQGSGIILFQGNEAQNEMIAQDFCPPSYNKAEFKKMLSDATSDPYSFMYINRSLPMNIRYRKRLAHIYHLGRLNGSEGERTDEPEKGSKKDAQKLEITYDKPSK